MLAFSIAAVLFLLPSTVSAVDLDSHNTTNPASGGILLVFLVVYLSRKREIGGWLLYFYFQIYVTFLFSMLFISPLISNLSPDNWDDMFKYSMFIISTVPSLVMSIIVLVISTLLLKNKNSKYLKILRQSLVFQVVFGLIAVSIDCLYFADIPSNLFFDGLALCGSIVWVIYFARSSRVQKVFVERSWFEAP